MDDISPETTALIWKIIRAEMVYLNACGWICYIPGEKDPVTGQYKMFSPSRESSDLFTQKEAMKIQRDKHNF